MNLALLSYLFGMLQNLQGVCILGLFIGIILIIMSPMIGDMLTDKIGKSLENIKVENSKKTKQVIKRGFIILVISLIISIIIPSQRTFFIYAGEKLSKQKNVNVILNKTYRLINKKLDKELKDVKWK